MFLPGLTCICLHLSFPGCRESSKSRASSHQILLRAKDCPGLPCPKGNAQPDGNDPHALLWASHEEQADLWLDWSYTPYLYRREFEFLEHQFPFLLGFLAQENPLSILELDK